MPDYTPRIHKLIYSQEFGRMDANERADLIAAILDQMGAPEGVQQAVKAIVSDYQPSDDVGAGHEEGGVVYNAIHGIEDEE